MMDKSLKEIEDLFPGYFSDDISEDNRVAVDAWRKESPENEKTFQVAAVAWRSVKILDEMQHFDSFNALRSVNSRLKQTKKTTQFFKYIQRIAAILVIPLFVYAAYLTNRSITIDEQLADEELWQTVTSRYGTVTQLVLSDSTKVWLSSGSSLSFPKAFVGATRNVSLNGEAYFDVTHISDYPFVIKANDLNVKVLGTELNVSCFNTEISEVVLVDGEVNLWVNDEGHQKDYGKIMPGERAIFRNDKKSLHIDAIDVSRYISWREGVLTFDGENLSVVSDQLGKWFNADILIEDPAIADYTYCATITVETLEQVMKLLSMASPISYKIEQPQKQQNGEYSKWRVHINKK